MTTYRNISTTETDADSAIRQMLIQALEWNPRAILEGDASAPNIGITAIATNTIPGTALLNNSITNAKIASNTIVEENLYAGTGLTGAVGQGQLSASTGTYITAVKYNPGTSYGQAWSATGGTYMLGWQSYTVTAGRGYIFQIGYYPFISAPMGAAITTPTPWIWMGGDPSQPASNFGLNVYYVTASPPYHLPADGDGNDLPVRKFVFIDVDTSGKITSAAIIDDPPWYRAHHYPGYKYHPDGRITWEKPVLPISFNEARGNPAKMRQYIDALKYGEKIEIEIRPVDKCTPELMDKYPHPFGLPGGDIGILDPGSQITDDILDLIAAGADGAEIIDNIRVKDPAPRGIRRPSGVELMRVDWR